MNLLSAIPLRAYLYAALAAFIGYLLWREHYLAGRLRTVRAENVTLSASLTAERENVRKANEASERYAISLENLKAARDATPTRVVRLCGGTASVPATGAATGVDASGSERLPQAPGPDIGPRLYDLADEADQCAAQRDALIDWIRSR